MKRAVVATIGVFDGVHRGHAAILDAARRHARRLGGRSLILTFDRHPLETLAPRAAPRALMTLAQRIEALRKFGFSRLLVLPFTRRLASMTAEAFARRVLVERAGVTHLRVGYDFHFGRGGVGDAGLLRELGSRWGFTVAVHPPVLHRGEPISSTRIRRLVSMGRLPEAAGLLGHPVVIRGRRVRGRALGRRLGAPTLNYLPENSLLPPRGVYAARIASRGIPGAANLGVRPTLQRAGLKNAAGRRVLLEVHCLGAAGRLPRGKREDISLIRFIRRERAFSGLPALKRAIAADVARIRGILARPRGRA